MTIKAHQLDQFRRKIRGMPPQELAAVRAAVDEELVRQQHLPPMPLAVFCGVTVGTLNASQAARAIARSQLTKEVDLSDELE